MSRTPIFKCKEYTNNYHRGSQKYYYSMSVGRHLKATTQAHVGYFEIHILAINILTLSSAEERSVGLVV